MEIIRVSIIHRWYSFFLHGVKLTSGITSEASLTINRVLDSLYEGNKLNGFEDFFHLIPLFTRILMTSLSLWKDADPGLPEVEDAKKRLADL